MEIIPLGREVNHVLAADTPLRVDKPAVSAIAEWPPRNKPAVECPPREIQYLALSGEGAENRILIGSKAPQDFVAADVDTTTDAITITAHGFVTGDGPYQVSSTGTLPGGLAASTDYYAVVIDANTFQLASSRANALVGTIVDLTSQGSGTHTITGLQNVGFPPTSTVQDGSGGLLILPGQSLVIPAPESFTIVGNTDAILTYFFVEGDD